MRDQESFPVHIYSIMTFSHNLYTDEVGGYSEWGGGRHYISSSNRMLSPLRVYNLDLIVNCS